MTAIQEIIAWSNTLPPWQSDALRRIFTSDRLSAHDEDDLLKMLLASNKVPIEGEAPPPIPFSEVVKQTSNESRHIVLKELHTLENVNALVSGQSLKFAINGLTVIYGENGAGKSGYARVLKHACHARDKGEAILPNIAKPDARKPSAVIELSVDGADLAVHWMHGSPPPDVLAEIAVFDAHCARVFIDQANEVVYLPYGLDVFAKLCTLCKSLKDKISARLRDIPRQFATAEDFSTVTAAGRFIFALSAKSDVQLLEKLISFSQGELDRLTQLQQLVATARANAPRKRAAEIRRVKSRFEQLLQKTAVVANALSTDSLQRIHELADTAKAACRAAELASAESFADEPIPLTGSDPWKVLFAAAKRFSEEQAYPDEEFPVTREGAVCVLCQQLLSTTARERLERFSDFIRNETARQKAEAEKALTSATVMLIAADTECLDKDPTLVDELVSHDQQVATNIMAFLASAASRKYGVLKALADGSWDTVPSYGLTAIEDLKRAITDLEAAALAIDKVDDPEEMRKLEQELLELDDRFRLARRTADVKTFIDAKRLEVALRLCEKAVDTSPITRFGSNLMERSVTEQLSEALRAELEFFGVQCVPLNIRKLGDRGKTKHQLTIAAGTRPSHVLSEGEQRVVAIACFLAELSTASIRSPVIFDDPVSSLDHRYRERVAKRLVNEAQGRQVVVFTHDIVMLLAIERECGEQQVPLQVHTIRRAANGPGECPATNSRPWHACKTKERLGILKNATPPLKKMHAQSQAEYETIAADVYGKLRETWERAVEEVVLQDVVQRFRPSVETLRLKGVAVDPTDYAIIDHAMSKCSTWMTGHDAAAAIGSAFPTPAELDDDIGELEAFLRVLKDRSDRTSKAAATLIEPPKAQLATQRASRFIDSSAAASIA